MTPMWAFFLGCCAIATAQLVVLQPSIGYSYPPQVVSPGAQQGQGGGAGPQGEGYFYGAPQRAPSLQERFQGPNQVAPPPQGPYAQVPFAQAQGDGFPQEAECLLVASTGSSVSGELHLTQAAPGAAVRVQGTVYGLSPGLHGFHVHRDPNTGDDCKGAGPHFNPYNQTHGAPDAVARHAGDLGNIEADGAGVASVELAADALSLAPGAAGYAVGRAIVVHAKADDLGLGGDDESLRTGNAGARLACCVIAQRY